MTDSPADVTVPPLVTLTGVDVLATGQWDLSSGEATFTKQDLADAVDAAQCPSIGNPVIKIGHWDPRYNPDAPEGDGTPAIGRVRNMALASSGNKITGDLAGMPGWLGAVLSSAYPKRSIEGCYDVKCQQGHMHPFVITGLALLGVEPPGVGVLNGLPDVAALYGVQIAAGARTWTVQVEAEAGMAGRRAPVTAAAVTTEDVRRAWFDRDPPPPWSQWITEVQIDPTTQLIVCDDMTSDVYRVPFTIKDSAVTFGDPVAVEVEYVDIPVAAARAAKITAARLPGQSVTYTTREQSRAGITAAWSASVQEKNLGKNPSASALKAMYALPGDTKSDSKLPHHDVGTDGTVGAANPDGCLAGISAINGAHGGLKGVSSADLTTAYNHLAKHMRDAGEEPPELAAAAKAAAQAGLVRLQAVRAAAGDSDLDDNARALIASLDAVLDEAVGLIASAGDLTADEGLPEPVAQCLDLIAGAESIADQIMATLGIFDPDDADAVTAGQAHGPYSGEHAHPHSPMGSQGGDATHDHAHSHSGDARHAHVHAAGATKGKRGGSKVDFTDEQKAALRASLGLADDAELTAEQVLTAAAELKQRAETPVAAGKGGKLPEGAMVIDRDAWAAMQQRTDRLEAAHKRGLIEKRDQVITAAIKAGKFGPASRDRYEAAWDKDPENTEALIESLRPGVPVGDIGSPGGDLADADMPEYERLFGRQGAGAR